MATQKTIWIAAGAVVLLLIAPALLRAVSTTSMEEALSAAARLIARFEGFRASPYWDVRRYSWGYGTPAPGPSGTITPAEGMAELQAHSLDDYNALASLITRPLTINQWASLLSFAYEEGHGSPGAGALVNDINGGDDTVLEKHWKEYIYADGVVDSDIVKRRDAEWDVWLS